MSYFLTVCIAFVLSVSTVFAQVDSSSFAIRVFGGTDTEAPTTPTLTSATALSTDQIDLTWSTATDNFLVHGYVVFQNGTAIATTTLTNYSDTGLTASTTYSYFVRAFDPSYNYSSSSNVLQATTDADPVPPTAETGSNQGTAARIVLDELVVTPGVSTSTFFIKTARPARFEMRWGRTNAYELGYIVNDRYVSTYETTIGDLEPATRYEYEIVGYTPQGKAFVLKQGQFTTLGYSDIYPPANVNRFVATASGNDVRLSWVLPEEESLSYVRIVRSHLGFPAYPYEGAIVYQGLAEGVIDKGILSQYSPAYYAAFVVDAAGNISSGAIAIAYAGQPDGQVIVPTRPGTGPVEDTVASTSPALPPGTQMPDLSEIFLLQSRRTQNFAQMEPILDSAQSFVISIPKDAVSSNLKTIIVSMSDPTNAKLASSFLLKLNKEETAYEAVIAPLALEGMSRMIVQIYDYKAAVVGQYEKTVMFKNITPKRGEPVLPGLYLSDLLLLTVAIVVPLLLALLLFLLYRRRRV